MAEGLATAGAHVIVNSRQSDSVNSVVEQLKSKGLEVSGAAFDVAQEDQVLSAFDGFDKAGVAIDILINNAGIQHRQPMVELSLKDWHRVMDTNITAAFIVGREAAKRMIARGKGGKIINIGSLTSQAARPTIAPYTVAKGGIKMLSRAMAAEWAQFKRTVRRLGEK
jgi:gluconate 5-dehydrogenase